MNDGLDPDELERRGLGMMAGAVRRARQIEADQKAGAVKLATLIQTQAALPPPIEATPLPLSLALGMNAVPSPFEYRGSDIQARALRDDHRRVMEAYEFSQTSAESATPVALNPEALQAEGTGDFQGGFFVWLRGEDWRAATTCEKWPDDCPCAFLKREAKASAELLDIGRRVIKKHRISAAEMIYSLAELAGIFPLQPKETDHDARDAKGAAGAATAGGPGHLPGPSDEDGNCADAYRRWEMALVSAVLSGLHIHWDRRRHDHAAAAGSGYDRQRRRVEPQPQPEGTP